MASKEEIHVRAWTEDRRRMHRVDQHLNHTAEASSKDAGTTIQSAPRRRPAQIPIVPASAPVLPRFVEPPRFVATAGPEDGAIVIDPAPEQRPDWSGRIADCFGVGPQAARALLSRLRSHLAGGGTLSVHTLNNALATVHAYAPRNVIEAELVVAMVIASLEADRQIVSGQQGGHLPTILERTRLGQKFLGLQFQALDRLLRLRGLSTQQTIIVKRMTVSANALVLPTADG